MKDNDKYGEVKEKYGEIIVLSILIVICVIVGLFSFGIIKLPTKHETKIQQKDTPSKTVDVETVNQNKNNTAEIPLTESPDTTTHMFDKYAYSVDSNKMDLPLPVDSGIEILIEHNTLDEITQSETKTNLKQIVAMYLKKNNIQVNATSPYVTTCEVKELIQTITGRYATNTYKYGEITISLKDNNGNPYVSIHWITNDTDVERAVKLAMVAFGKKFHGQGSYSSTDSILYTEDTEKQSSTFDRIR